jgi:hypothetical protein
VLISVTVKLVREIMGLLGCVLLLTILLVGASCHGGKSSPNVAAKVGGMCLRGNSYSQGR